MGGTFQYAVKFVCGTSKGEVVAPGDYWTAINVHNPAPQDVEFKIKVAVALPGARPGPVSEFEEARLGPDQALEIDREDILRRVESGEFLKGYLVIESEVELDVVAVYTAAGGDGTVATLHTERVAGRRLKVDLPDLVPVPDEHGWFCRLVDVEGSTMVLVTVKNQGTAAAGPFSTEVDFYQHGHVVLPTGPLSAGDSVDLYFPLPPRCWDPDCQFQITVDVYDEVLESDEENNVATALCLG